MTLDNRLEPTRRDLLLSACAGILVPRTRAASLPDINLNARNFVTLLYKDLLRREPDPVGLLHRVEELEHGSTPAQTVRAVQESEEYQTLLIDDLYRAFLGRPVDAPGLRAHLASFDPKRSSSPIVIGILTSPEYYEHRSGGNDRMFLTALHLDLLGRNTDSTLADWEQALAKGIARGEIIRRLLYSDEAINRNLRRLVQRYLLRPPTPREVQQYAPLLRKGLAPELLLPELLASQEYLGRAADNTLSSLERCATKLFERLASDLFKRPPSGQEYVDWVPRITSGLSGRIQLETVLYDLILLPNAAGGQLSSLRLKGVHQADRQMGRGARTPGEIATIWLQAAARRGISRVRSLAYWADRIEKANHYHSALVEFLASEDYLGFPPDLYAAGFRCWTPPPGTFRLPARRQQPPPAQSFRTGQPLIATSYFYWYDSIHGMNYLISPDPERHDDGKLALTLNPPDLSQLSFRRIEWHERQLADMCEAGIDIVLPVFFGTPFSEPSDDPGERERGWNQRSAFSEPGLRNIVRACDRLSLRQLRPPRIGMFYDTSTLYNDNAKRWHVTLNSIAGKRWFYESIRNFFSLVPARLWAMIDGRPMVWVYHPSFGQHVEEDLYPRVRSWFFADFEVEPYIVTAAEEEAPRVVDRTSLQPWVKKLQSRPYLSVLAELLAEDEFYRRAGSTPEGFVTRLYRKFLSRDPGIAEGQKDVTTALQEGRLRFARQFLSRSDVLTNIALNWWRRYLRRESPRGDPGIESNLANLAGRLAAGEDYFSVLASLLAGPEFYLASGATDEYLIDNLYQQVVWRCPNPGCETCSTTSTGEEGKQEFLGNLKRMPRQAAISEFLRREEVLEATVSGWFFEYFGRFNPGPADNTFYWSAAICPTMRGVASIGPGYDQSGLRTRPKLVVPREGGRRYRAVWEKILAMQPRPWLVHVESWNELFEGTAICETKEYGRQYIELTRTYSDRFHQHPPTA
jgi:hypothetical protein